MEEVRRVVGTNAEIARGLGVSPSAVSRYGVRRPIPRAQRRELERMLADPPELRRALEEVRKLYELKVSRNRQHDWLVLLALLDLPSGDGVRVGRP